jgi:hypothetical protein
LRITTEIQPREYASLALCGVWFDFHVVHRGPALARMSQPRRRVFEKVFENGLRLGPVGGRIVGEVFIGLLQADKDSYLSVNRNCKPTLPSSKRGDFEIMDLLKFAGVVHPLN